MALRLNNRVETANDRLNWLLKNLHHKLPELEFSDIRELNLDADGIVTIKPPESTESEIVAEAPVQPEVELKVPA